MREFVITTESNCDLSKSYVEEHEIGVIPHYYTVEDEMYGEDKELTSKEFYDAMRNKKKAATMASNPAVILDRFTEYAKAGKDILHISFSSALSSGYNNIVNGANEVMEEYPDTKIIVIDTLSASMNEGAMIMKAVEMRRSGKTIEETAQWVQAHVANLCAVFTVDDLDFLYRGGRLSKSSAVLGTMINIKPILHINDEGKLVALSKTRGRKKSLSTLVDLMESKVGSFKDNQIQVTVIHGDCEEEANSVADMIKDRFGYQNVLVAPIGPSIGAHSGPGTIGVLFMGDER